MYLKCNDEFSTLQPVTAFKLSKEAKQKFKENLIWFASIENDIFCGKTRPKKTWIFSKLHCLNGFNRQKYNIDQPIFFMNKLKIFQRLIAWLFCLDEFEKFASQFYLPIFVI